MGMITFRIKGRRANDVERAVMRGLDNLHVLRVLQASRRSGYARRASSFFPEAIGHGIGVCYEEWWHSNRQAPWRCP
jgi:hypothetical protein